jgi:hypothetical protein
LDDKVGIQRMTIHDKLSNKAMFFHTRLTHQTSINRPEQKGLKSFLQGWAVLFILFFMLLAVGILSGEWIGELLTVPKIEKNVSYETYIDPPQQNEQ